MHATGPKPTLLFVEDEEDIALAYADVFGRTYRVLTALTGRQAIETVEGADDIDLVLLDYRLDDIAGIEVLREIKLLRPAVPVILLTAYGDEEVAVKAFRYGARDYLKKPISCDQLRTKIEFYLGLKHADKSGRRTLLCDDTDYSAKVPLHDVGSELDLNIAKARRFIDDNFMTRIGLEAASKEACISRHHFSRAFKKTTNVTYKDYITDRRVRKARELLENGNRSITEIAHAVGYSDVTNLSRNFKKLIGVTPAEFRGRLDRDPAGPNSEE